MNFCPNCGHSLQGMGGTAGTVCPDPTTCSWSIQDHGNSWRCSHGVTVTKHPRGYCNGGCCR